LVGEAGEVGRWRLNNAIAHKLANDSG
jgi:hypothetical protein